MTFNAIALKMMRENYQQYLLYMSCNAFAIFFVFLFFSIYYNETIVQMKESHSFDTVLTIPAVGLIIFMFFFIQYAHQMFIKKRKQEFGVLLAIGMTPKNIIRLLITENLLVAAVALMLGLIFGGVFSKLFFYAFTYFSPLTPELFHLSFQMFGYTAIVYLILFCFTIGISIYQIQTQSSITMMESKLVIDEAKTTHGSFGIVGVVLIIFSILGLILTYRSHSELLFFWAVLTFIGLYLFLANIVHTLIYLIKGIPTLYYRFILLFSSLEQKQKKLTSILTLTSVMIMITTLYCTITLTIAKEEYDRMVAWNPSDVAFISEKGDITEQQLASIIGDATKVKQVKVVPYLELKKEDYDGWVYYTNILAQSNYERIIEDSYAFQNHECIVFINYSDNSYHDQYSRCEILSNSYEVETTHVSNPITHISNSIVHMVVTNEVWEQLKADIDLRYQYHVFVEDWEQSLPAVERLLNSHSELQFELDSFTSKVEQSNRMTKENSILFYLLTFLSILFYFGAFVLLYLNLLADIDVERAKFQKLFKIGITKKELKQQFNYETALLIFIPTMIGLLLAFLYLLGMSQKAGGLLTNTQIIGYFILMSGIYFAIQLGFYMYIKTKLFKKVWDVE